MVDLSERLPASLGVLGSPIGHSLSPRIHAAAYEVLGLPWTYSAVDCSEDCLETFLAQTEWNAMSLTMPLKRRAYELASILDSVAEQSGVVNTLVRDSTGAAWRGFNTDVYGLAAALREAAGSELGHIIVLGGGATAVSAVLAAAELGAKRVTALVRTPSKAESLVAVGAASGVAVTVAPLDSGWPGPAPADVADIVVSTIPGHQASQLTIPEHISAAVPLYDVAYDPWPTPLAQVWADAGGQVHSGISMLIHQALVQMRIFILGAPGRELPDEAGVLEAMRLSVAR